MNFVSRLPIMAMTGIWLTMTIVGFTCLHRYSKTPAPVGPVSVRTPQQSTIQFDSAKPTLIVFLHPYCPCSGATFHVVSDLVEKYHSSACFIAVFVRPPNTTEDWSKSDLYVKCLRTPSISTIVDADGKEAKKFGAVTSGQTYVYGPDKRLRFSGGVTSSRGSIQSGRERETIESALEGLTKKPESAPVFGCSLI